MKISCTGSTGRVGRLLVKQGVVPLSCNVTVKDDVERAIDSVSPDVIIHLAGISNVDYCEMEEHWEEVRKVNFVGTYNVLRPAFDRHIPVVYISSEHVFPGHPWWGRPYSEQSPVSRKAINNYAMTKIACEGYRTVFSNMKVVRTSYLFDYLRITNEELPVADLTYSFPTFIHRSYIYLPHFAHNLLHFVQNFDAMPSVLHLAGCKTVSQYQFLSEFARHFHVPVDIQKRTHEWPAGDGYPVHARRPHRAGLSVELSRSLGFPLFSYHDGFSDMRADNVRG